MNLAALLTTVLAIAASLAVAAPSLTVSGELPCSRDELAAALALRVGAVEVRVHGIGDRVRVEVGGRDRVVPLDGARGPAAARRIALAAEDLALPELPDGAPAVVVVRPARARFSIAAQIGAEAAPRGTVVAGIELGRGDLRGVLEAGVAAGTASDAWMLGVPVRAGVAFGDAPTFVVTAIAMPFEVYGGRGDRNVVAGAGVEVRGDKRAGSIDVVYQVGLDGFVNQVEYQWAGAPVFATPRVALWGGLGLSWRAW